jgi:hypothetical protein
MKLLLFVIFAASAFAQTTVNASAVLLDTNATGALARWMMGQNTAASTTLASPIDAVSNTFTLASGTGFGATSAIVVNGVEIAQCTVKAGAVLTCTRAQIGTTAVAHAAGVSVKEMIYKTPNQAGTELMRGQLKGIMRSDQVIQAQVAAAAAAAEAIIAAGVQ